MCVGCTSFTGIGVYHKTLGDAHHVHTRFALSGQAELYVKTSVHGGPDTRFDPQVRDCLFLGSGRAAGIIGPGNEYFLVSGAKFRDFGGAPAIQGCASCCCMKAPKQGAYTYRYEKLEFVRSNVRVAWRCPYKQIHFDIDGTLTGHANGSVTAFRKYHTWDNDNGGPCELGGRTYSGGVVCNGTVRVRRMMVDAVEPQKLDKQAIFLKKSGADVNNGTEIYGGVNFELYDHTRQLYDGPCLEEDTMVYLRDVESGEWCSMSHNAIQVGVESVPPYFRIRSYKGHEFVTLDLVSGTLHEQRLHNGGTHSTAKYAHGSPLLKLVVVGQVQNGSWPNDVVLIQSYYDGSFIGGEYGGVMGVSKGAYGGTFGYKQDRARKFEVQRKLNLCRYQDHLDHVTFRDAVDGYGWAVPVVTNRDYFVNFDSKVDFQSMKIEWGNSFYLINYGQEDESVKLKWPYVNYRYRFDVAPAFKAPSNLADYVTGEQSADTCPFGSFRLPRDECMRAAKAVSPRVVGG